MDSERKGLTIMTMEGALSIMVGDSENEGIMDGCPYMVSEKKGEMRGRV